MKLSCIGSEHTITSIVYVGHVRLHGYMGSPSILYLVKSKCTCMCMSIATEQGPDPAAASSFEFSVLSLVLLYSKSTPDRYKG